MVFLVEEVADACLRKRQGRCYELAGRAMLDEGESDAWMLVHGRLSLAVVLGKAGTLTGRVCARQKQLMEQGWYDHAWIELDDGRIYDPVLNSYMPTDQYVAKWRAVVDHRYSYKEFIDLVNVSHNSGPWTDDERRAAAAARKGVAA
jgi:hypothetical protein